MQGAGAQIGLLRRFCCTHRIGIEVVDGTGTRDNNGNTSDGVDNSLVLRNPGRYAVQEAGGGLDVDDGGRLARRH